MTKLNLGSGQDYRTGFINIDAMENVGADLVLDITKELPFPAHSVQEIIAQDILEHLTIEQQEKVLEEIARVLESGGLLRVRIPNIDDIFERFVQDPEVRNLFLYGDTGKTGVWGAHKSGHTIQSFLTLCRLHNLQAVKVTAVDTNWEMILKKVDQNIQIKNILFINQTLGFGGAEVFNAQLIAWMREQQIQVWVYSTSRRFIEYLGQGIHIPIVIDIIGNIRGLLKGLILFPFGIIYYFYIVWQNRSVDLIYLTGFIEKIIVTPWAKFLNVPVVWVEFGPLEVVGNKFFKLPKVLYTLVKNLPEYVIVPSQNTFKRLITYIHLSQAKLKLIPCARDFEYKKSPVISDSVCCVSRIEPGKGQDLLLAAWPKVLQKFPQATLYIVGEGGSLPNTSNVILTGRVDDALKYIAQSEIFVFPSVWPLEGFGLAAIEAMGLGKPVIGFNTGPLPETVTLDCGILVEAGNVNQLAEAIIKLLKDKALAKKMGQQGRKRYAANYTFTNVGPKYLEVFRRAVARRLVK